MQAATGRSRPFGRASELGTVSVLAALCVCLAIAKRSFASPDNLLEVARAFSVVAIMAVGETLVILTGGIDLSVGSVLGVSGCVCGLLMSRGVSIPVAILAGLATGACFGLVNGLLITRGELPPFIATLGTLSIGRSLAYTVTGGWPISNLPQGFLLAQLPGGFLLRNLIPIVLMLAATAAGTVYLMKTRLGRETYAVGGNEAAARLSGVNVRAIKLIAYTVTGLLCALAGIIHVSVLEVAEAPAGQGYELDVIAATVIGGTSLSGGQGTVVGALLGAAIMGVIRNGLVLLEVSPFWHLGIIGAVIILAVLIDVWRKRS